MLKSLKTLFLSLPLILSQISHSIRINGNNSFISNNSFCFSFRIFYNSSFNCYCFGRFGCSSFWKIWFFSSRFCCSCLWLTSLSFISFITSPSWLCSNSNWCNKWKSQWYSSNKSNFIVIYLPVL